MNKLIKSAMMMASVGVMLCIVGCGEKDPVKSALETIKEVNAAAVAADVGELFSAAELAEIEGATALSDKQKNMILTQGEKFSKNMTAIKQYAKTLGEVKAIDSTIYRDLMRFDRFLEADSAAQAEAAAKAQKKLEQLNALKKAMGK